MKFTIVERKTKISDELRDYAVKKVEKLDRYFTTDSESVLTFSELKGRQTAEITVKQGQMIVRAEETTTDMFASVDGAINRIERQIRKNKTRLEKRLRQGAFEKAAAHAEQMAESEETYELIRRKRFAVEAMSVEEAMLQMNLIGHQFYFFRNADEGNVYSVLYKRANGGYGLIEGE
ncbi:MAG: ribosome-associated translation inhibitor RaiA [Butyricicoccus sp.]|nr:ribosome-associated translation inhibitor RaiA [Butyricicoccus pullicaecorum]MCI6719214.1 ribosome-associated translation inhibitor RaiA [Clostridiales bacterium]MDY5972882.1 ribosome-associated translation inhibitor RaiA [Butyricicoccus sp.]